MTTDSLYTNRYFLSCDWGTTSLRLNLVEKDTAKAVTGIASSDGIKKVNRQWDECSEEKKRTEYFLSFLLEKISVLEMKAGYDLSGVPVVVSGMASSSIGMKELPYKKIPLSLNSPELYVETFEKTDHLPHNLYLVSGICTTDDVMRGEETQLLGLEAEYKMQNGVYILPGTHSKHVHVRDHTVTHFNSYMTGELFDLLTLHSILSGSVSKEDSNSVGDAFTRGIEAALTENLLQSLFKIRANAILHQTDSYENRDYLSGLLIGLEVANLKKERPEQIILAGDKRLLPYYASACKYLKLNYFEAGCIENITISGHHIILNKLQS